MPAIPLLYLHGFASGPGSKKGLAFDAHFSTRGFAVERLDLRVPSLPHLRVSAMLATVRAALDRTGPAVVVGSSLGGLTACRVAESDPRVRAMVLLAPALQMIPRWRRRLGERAWEHWRTTGWLDIFDHALGGAARIDFGFTEDGAAVDAAGDGWPTVMTPTLIFHGRSDDIVDIDLSRELVRRHPQKVRLVELNDDHELVSSLPQLLEGSERFLADVVH